MGTSYNYSLALTAGGHVLTWGYNGSGQLGTGFSTASEIPVRVELPRGITVIAVANGGYHALALTSAGQIMAWGNGGFGELGNGHHSRTGGWAYNLTWLTIMGSGSTRPADLRIRRS